MYYFVLENMFVVDKER